VWSWDYTIWEGGMYRVYRTVRYLNWLKIWRQLYFGIRGARFGDYEGQCLLEYDAL
jgi:hypothetical protein